MQKGFNSGYNLKGVNSDQADRFMAVFKDREDDYAVGFIAGVTERTRELFKTRAKNYTISPKAKSKNSRGKDKDRTMGRDER